MRIVNSQSFPYCRQCSVGCVEERISRGIVLWSDPFSFHYPPEGFDNVQMRGIGRNVEDKESSLFPDGAPLSDYCVSVHACIIEYHKCLFVESEGELFEEIGDLRGINRFTCTEAFEAVVTTSHPKDIESFCSFRWYIYVFSRKLPSVRDVAFGANMGFIAIEEIDLSFCVKRFKFLQLLCLIRVELRRGNTLWTFSYTSISCAKADKKRLKVNSLASLPEEFCHASLADRTLCRSDSIALRTASSSEQSMMGLRPCPGRVYNPLIPSSVNRFTQPLTLWAVMSVCSPTRTELKPSDLSNTARQRMRKQWLSPVRKPKVSAFRSDSVNDNILIFIRIYILYAANIRQFYYM